MGIPAILLVSINGKLVFQGFYAGQQTRYHRLLFFNKGLVFLYKGGKGSYGAVFGQGQCVLCWYKSRQIILRNRSDYNNDIHIQPLFYQRIVSKGKIIEKPKMKMWITLDFRNSQRKILELVGYLPPEQLRFLIKDTILEEAQARFTLLFTSVTSRLISMAGSPDTYLRGMVSR